MKKQLLIGAFILSSFTLLGADDDFFYEDTSDENIITQTLDESVITTTGFETTVRDTPKNITIITKDEIQAKGAKDVGEALKGVPGLTVNSMGGSDVSFDLRGQGANAKSNVKVLLDGISLNSIDLSGYKTSNIPIDSVERIEVIPSGGSVLYGDGAVGGVINIITSAPLNKKNYGQVGSEFGSNGLSKYNASYGTKISDDLLLKLDYTNKSYDGYRSYSDDDLDAFSIESKYLISDKQDLTFKYSYSNDDFKAPGSLTRQEVDDDREQSLTSGNQIDGTNEENNYTIKYNNSLSDKLLFTLDTNYRDQDYDSTSYSSYGSSKYSYDTDVYTVRPQVKYSYLEDSYIIVGTDLEKAKTDVTEGFSKGERKKDSYGAYFLNKYKINNWELSQGYRYQKTKYDTPSEDENFYNDAFDISANYLYSDTGSTYISYSRAFRTPNTDELAYWHGDYKPQESDTVEVGMKDYFLNTYVSISVFNTITDDEIVYAEYDGVNSSNMNLDGKTRRTGVEAYFEQYFNKLTLRESFTYLNQEVEDGTYEGKDIPGVPNLLYSLGANYAVNENITVDTLLSYHGKSYAYSDFDNEASKVDDYITVDTKVSYDFKNGFELYGGINNIFNEKYYDYVGYSTWSGSSDSKTYYPAAEREYYIGFKYNY